MTQANPQNALNYLTCVPPPLPDYLARTYTLTKIIGVPTDEDVKKIHDVIRAMNHLSNVPEMYDPKLSTQLAQFLFNAQMAVYRSEYPLIIFPANTTYTPPTFPSHIPISLEPIVGAPSDEQLQSAHNAVRTMENLANTPFIFDPILSTKLSQHLFNIQFARYLQDSVQGQLIQAPVQTHVSHEESPHSASNDPLAESQTTYHPEVHLSVPTESTPSGETHSESAIPNHAEAEQISTAPPAGSQVPGAPPLETSYQLGRVEVLLEDIRRALVGTHNNLVRHMSGNRRNTVMNEKGELPWLKNLPYISLNSSARINQILTDAQVVGYLRCYNIGNDLIEADGTENLRKGSEAAARELLAGFLAYGYLFK